MVRSFMKHNQEGSFRLLEKFFLKFRFNLFTLLLHLKLSVSSPNFFCLFWTKRLWFNFNLLLWFFSPFHRFFFFFFAQLWCQTKTKMDLQVYFSTITLKPCSCYWMSLNAPPWYSHIRLSGRRAAAATFSRLIVPPDLWSCFDCHR